MLVYENPRGRGRRRKTRRSKARRSNPAPFAFSTSTRRRRTKRGRGRRRSNPSSIGSRARGVAGGVAGALKHALPIVGGFWAADFGSKFITDRVAMLKRMKYGRQTASALLGAVLLTVGKRLPFARAIGAGAIGWSLFSSLNVALLSGWHVADKIRPRGLAGLGQDDDLDGLGIVGQPELLGLGETGEGGVPANLLGLGSPQAMLFGIGGTDDTYGGRA